MQSVTNIPSTSNATASYTGKSHKPHHASQVANSAVKDDSYTPSGKTPVASSETTSALDGFDLKAFRAKLHDQLLTQIKQAKELVKNSGSDIKWVNDILYAVDPSEKAAPVPEEYSADNTSQRIVDFALSFRGQASDLTDEEFVQQIRDAIDKGFHLAKGDLGDLPGPVAKLFNDTYEATMKKLDQALADMKKGKIADNTATEVDASIVAATTTAGDAKTQDVAANNVEASKAASAYQKNSRWSYAA